MKFLPGSLVICLLFCFHFSLHAQPEQVRAVLEKQAVAWNNGDIEGFMTGYWENDSLRFISKKGITYGWKPVLENYRKSYGSKEKMGKLDFTVLKVEMLSKESAFVTGHWKVSAHEIHEGNFSLLFKRMNGKWVIVCDHTS